MSQRKFSHVSNFTGYMQIVFNIVTGRKEKQKILDVPAGNGLLAEKLRDCGHEVICGDINSEKEHYVFTDMEETLPFDDGEFDTVICLEGIEHVLEPAKLISELCRISKNKGRIVISLPNIQNLFSRYLFLCTGSLYQFPPVVPLNMEDGEKVDRGHISSLSYIQLHHLFGYFGARVIQISGDRYKRKILIPILMPFIIIGYLWIKLFKDKDQKDNIDEINKVKRDLFKMPLLYSRSLILVFEKNSDK
ncbi:MAG: class I SAM-dependent methyltransferase [bacterium]|nr:class I SAM-dependent methyltransferase [bacterium]